MSSTFGVLGFRDPTANSAWYTSSTLTDSSTTGSSSASYPIANVQDPDLGKVYKRTGCTFAAGGKVIIDEYVVPVGGTWRLAIAALLNVQMYANGGAVPVDNVRVRCQVSTTGFGASPFFDQYRVINAPPPYGNSSDRPNAVFVIQPSPSSTERKQGGHASSSTAQYIRWTIDASIGYTNHDIIVGRSTRWAGLYANVCTDYSIGGVDDSAVLRSYSGAPYFLRRVPRKKVSGRFVNVPRYQVAGGVGVNAGSAESTVTFPRVHQFQGLAYPVIFVPISTRGYYASPPPDPGLYTEPDTLMQNEHIYGLLTRPLQADRVSGIAGGTDEVYQVPFEIEEIAP